MHRIDRVLERTSPRIGLSATLGDMSLAADFLRPGGGATVAIIESKSGSHELKILVKGYEEPRVVKVQPQTEPTETADDENDEEPATPRQIDRKSTRLNSRHK